MRKESKEIETVGELKEWLKDVPDSTPIGRLTDGYYKINKVGDVSFFVGEMPVGLPGEEVSQVILRISA